jgi:hypothetical protein
MVPAQQQAHQSLNASRTCFRHNIQHILRAGVAETIPCVVDSKAVILLKCYHPHYVRAVVKLLLLSVPAGRNTGTIGHWQLRYAAAKTIMVVLKVGEKQQLTGWLQQWLPASSRPSCRTLGPGWMQAAAQHLN